MTWGTTVLLPTPEGPESTTSFPCFVADMAPALLDILDLLADAFESRLDFDDLLRDECVIGL